jgi:hypothetical protein
LYHLHQSLLLVVVPSHRRECFPHFQQQCSPRNLPELTTFWSSTLLPA